MRMILSLGKALINKESCPYLLNICLPISSASIGGIRQMVVQIYRMDAILMGYYMTGQARTIMSSVMYKSKLNMGNNP